MPLHVLSTCAHHQEVRIVLYSLWYHHTCRCDDIALAGVMPFVCFGHRYFWPDVLVMHMDKL
jgi:hypothetical protein